eukprot:g50956.t1
MTQTVNSVSTSMALCADVAFCWDVSCIVVFVLGCVIALVLNAAFLSRMYINESLPKPSKINRICHKTGSVSSILNVYYAFLFVQKCDCVNMAQYISHALSANTVIFGWLAVGLITLEAAVTIQSKVLKSRRKKAHKRDVQQFFRIAIRGVMVLYLVANILVLVVESMAYTNGRAWSRVYILNPYMIACLTFTLSVIWVGKLKLLRTLAAQDKLNIEMLGNKENATYKKLIKRFQMALVWTTLLVIWGVFIYVFQIYALHDAAAYDLYEEGGWAYHFYFFVLVAAALSHLWFGWVRGKNNKQDDKREVSSELDSHSVKQSSSNFNKLPGSDRMFPNPPFSPAIVCSEKGAGPLGSPSQESASSGSGSQRVMSECPSPTDCPSPSSQKALLPSADKLASRASQISEAETQHDSRHSSFVDKDIEIEYVFKACANDLETKVAGGQVIAVPRVSISSPQASPECLIDNTVTFI